MLKMAALNHTESNFNSENDDLYYVKNCLSTKSGETNLWLLKSVSGYP